MKKNKPVNLGFQELKENEELITNVEFRSIRPGVGMVISSAQMQGSLVQTGQPYRTKESRIIRVMKGNARISINLVEYEVEKDTLIISPPNSLIELIEITPDYDFQIIVHENGFLPALQENSLSDLYEPQGTVLSMEQEEKKRITQFFSLLWESMHCTPFRREVVQHLIIALLNDIRYIRDQKQTGTPFHPSRQEEILRRFIALVNEYGKRERNTGFYADKLCLTTHYLSTVIREASGQTVMQWINQAVILEAKVLLKHSDLLVFQISDELNFPNPSFFSKFFKRITGMTPAEYQKQV